jgi:hypothetical protein
MNWKGLQRKRHDLFEELSRDLYEDTKKTSVGIASGPMEIRTDNLPNMNLGHYVWYFFVFAFSASRRLHEMRASRAVSRVGGSLRQELVHWVSRRGVL